MPARILLVAVVVVGAVVAPRTAAAHDFWLVPKTHHVDKPGPLPVQIFLGQPKEVTDFEPQPSQYARWEAHGGGTHGRVVPGKGGAPTLAHLLAEDVYSIMYVSKHSYVELKPDEFARYLETEGLEEIIAERKTRGESEQPGQEGFARYAKALVRVGNATAGYDRKLGMAFEIVALSDPFTGGVDGQLTFQLWYQGQPRANALMELFEIHETDHKIVSHGKVRTDAGGKFAFPTPPIGRWMVTGTVMRRAAYPVEADWESFWASLSFQVEPQVAPPSEASAMGSRKLGPILVFAGVLAVLGAVGVMQLRKARRKKA